MLLYKVLIGSRLYGTHRKTSDYDWIEVYSSMRTRPRQTITDEKDTIKVNLSTFMTLAGEGRHQYLEAAFAPRTETDMFYDMRRSFYPDTAKTVNLYRRTINKFGDHKARKKDKAMQTALRMTYNLEELLERGRFNPVLSDDLAQLIPSLSWADAYDLTNDRMSYLGLTFGL